MPLGINELELLNEPVEPDVYIVDNILPPGVTLLCGHQKIGKSWLALKLCLCATRGVDSRFGLRTNDRKARMQQRQVIQFERDAPRSGGIAIPPDG